MFSSKQIADYRAAALARIEAQSQDNERQIAELEARNAALVAESERLNLPLPPNACPRCFYEHGVTAQLYGAPADSREPGADRFQCPNGHDF